MGKYRKQVTGFAERESGVFVQFAGAAGMFELPRSHPGFDRFAALLREANESGIPVAFELEGNRIVSVG